MIVGEMDNEEVENGGSRFVYFLFSILYFPISILHSLFSIHPVNAYLGVVTSRPGRAFTTEVTEITEETMILSLT